MFKIDYNLLEKSIVENINIDDIQFRYNLFLGNLILHTTNKYLYIDWGWIPLLDFAISVKIISEKIEKQESLEEEFEFTESDAKIVFQRKGNIIEIRASFSNEILETNLENFIVGIKKFQQAIIFDIFKKNPILAENVMFQKLLSDVKNQ